MPQSKGENVDPRFQRMAALNSMLGKMYIDQTTQPGGYQRLLQNMNNLQPEYKGEIRIYMLKRMMIVYVP